MTLQARAADLPGLAFPLTRKLSRLVPLSPEEAATLAALQAATRPVSRNREIISAGRKYDGVFVLIEGTAIRYRVLSDGRRQVLNIALPGDFIGFPASFFETAPYSIAALSDALVSRIPFASLFGLFQSHPRLAAALFCSFSCEAAMYAEHLIDVGRRSALERVAHFLLELLTRLQAIDLADERSYRMPLTQELMGDALGLSVPHVNRTLRRLREDDLISIDGQIVVIKDIEALAALADFEKGYLSRFRIGELLAPG
ncbi:Crp/Fnr family transcriptional regulator [Pseudomonas sp.]|jgi:CRP-like cAMP-binding protein|uniref:Crp/Fnr family transcriptional regulator n=1 Tax=Pseudomonas sp. TaxID=306 RepID=UPI002E321EE5|nr:Crp/Fnr family transcriptional regulator [Pseudomonas sp.]HEX4548146.1 Crp/Fnr family transcriptional regulator [Pseudomonas sp.]